jgi:PPOX class probable F420-dependent enzyme
MTTIPESHQDLLSTDVAMLATFGQDGYPQVTALWFLLDDDGVVKLSLNTARQKVRNLQRQPACTLFLLDLGNPYRYLEVRGDAEIEPDDDYAFADRVGAKYEADLRVNDRAGESRVVVTIRPYRVNPVDMTA